MSIDWLGLTNSINWPQVIVSLILGGIITHFSQRWYQKRPQKSEFAVTALTITRSETDMTSKSMQFHVGAKGDLQNVNIREIVEVARQVLAEEVEDEQTHG